MKFLVLLLVLACSQAPVKVEAPSTTGAPTTNVTVQSSGEKPYLSVTRCTNCTPDQWKRIQDATVKVNKVVKGQCFRSGMEKRALIQTNGKTPSQVVDSLVSADIRIETEMYYTIKRVLGYTIEGYDKEWLNRKYMMSWNVCDLASLLAHETAHKVGYGHDYYSTARRPYSVNYSINAIYDGVKNTFDGCCK